MVKKQKSYSMSKNVKKCPKKLKFFSLNIHKGTVIFEKPQNLSKWGTKHLKNDMGGLNSKNINITGGGFP